MNSFSIGPFAPGGPRRAGGIRDFVKISVMRITASPAAADRIGATAIVVCFRCSEGSLHPLRRVGAIRAPRGCPDADSIHRIAAGRPWPLRVSDRASISAPTLPQRA